MAKTSKTGQKSISRYRDACTGKYVTKQFADKHPKTTVKENYQQQDGTECTGPRKK